MGRQRTATAERRDVYAMVTEQVIAALEKGTVPWHQPWTVGGTGLPKSLSTRKPYRGINVLLLGLSTMEAGYKSPWWGTYDKIKDLGGQVRKGQTGTFITLWRRFRKTVIDPVTGQPVAEFGFVLRYYKVFNADQADWPEGKAPAYEEPRRLVGDRVEAADKIIAGYPNAPTLTTGTAAFYRAALDTVTMPPLESFSVVDEFYSTMFHELTHSTGHSSRLARDGVKLGTFGAFGTPVYSKEELVAEMGAALLNAVAGIDTTVTLPNNAAYLRSWIDVLKGDARLVVNAAAQAQRAADHILGEHFGDDDESEE